VYRLHGTGTALLAPGGATVLYYNRNRWYSPSLGRFTSRDPNETTQPVVLSAYNGTTPYAGVTPAAIEQHYGDGLNRFAYLMSNPITGSDPMGLSSDPFAEIDDVIAGIQGEKAAAISAVKGFIGSSFNTAKLIAEFALSMLPGHDAVMLMKAMYSGEEVTWDMILFAGLDVAGPVGKIGGKAAKYMFKYADKLSDRSRMNMSANARCMVGSRVVDGAFDILDVTRLPKSKIAKKPKQRGQAPIGVNDNRVENHHVEQNPHGPYVEILRTEHLRAVPDVPGIDNRQQFNNARRRYWEREWDRGRFNDLPD
jgi:hypothetical protein